MGNEDVVKLSNFDSSEEGARSDIFVFEVGIGIGADFFFGVGVGTTVAVSATSRISESFELARLFGVGVVVGTTVADSASLSRGFFASGDGDGASDFFSSNSCWSSLSG